MRIRPSLPSRTLVRGTATSLGEVHHLLDLAGVAVLWLVAHEAQGLPSRGRVAAARELLAPR